MTTAGDVAPAVRSILESARRREGGANGPISVDARSLPAALSAADRSGRTPVIAEVKPTSPTTEDMREDDPVELARAMVDGGAAAISVLTEPTHFGGSPEALARVREAVDVPVLRKDFVLREDQLDVVAADLVLLIVRFVDDLEGLVAAARERGFQPLVEVHDRAELETALDAGADIVGVNNRDLAKLEVDLETFETVAPHADNVTLIAESGIATPEDARRMRAAGADGLLIGSAIVGEGDVAENTRELTRADDTENTRRVRTHDE